MAPTISAITAFGGMPSVSSGMNEVCAAALLALSGAATPSIAPRPKRLRMLGDLLLERVGGERRDHRAAARQDAEDRAEHRAARDRAGANRLRSCARRHQAGDLGLHDVAALGRQLEIAHDLGEAEHAHRDVDEADAVGQLRDVERHARLRRSRCRSRPSTAAGPNRIMAIALSTEPLASTTAKIRPSTISEKYSAGPNISASAVSGAPSAATSTVATQPAKNEPMAAIASAGPARPCLRHLVAVERGDHRGRLARDVDQDRGGRAAVLRAVIDAGEHDQRADRRQAEGDRQQHRDGGERADAGQHADQRADQRAEQTEHDVLSGVSGDRRTRARDSREGQT